MNSSLSSGQHPYSTMSDIASVVSILEQGLLCAHRGFFVEAASFFALAHEQLSPYQANHAAVVDAFLQSHRSYLFTLWFGVPIPPLKVTEAPYPADSKMLRSTRRFLQKC